MSSIEDMPQVLHRYVALYIHPFPKSAQGCKMPLQTIKEEYQKRPDLLNKRPHDRPGHET